MGDQQEGAESRRFGRYLRTAREDRRLSLDAVEELTVGYPDRVTKSHLSRIETGSAVPSFGKMFALSRVYGIPISALAERFELDLLRELSQDDPPARSASAVLAEVERIQVRGDYQGGLILLAAAQDRLSETDGTSVEYADMLKIHEANFLAHLERYELAKVSCEELLSKGTLDERQRLQTQMIFIICCYRLKRYTIADMAIRTMEDDLLEQPDVDHLRAKFTAVRAGVLVALGQLEQAAEAYKSAITLFREVSDPFEACRAQINLAQVRIDSGQTDSAAGHIRSALKVAEESGYDRLKALALSHLAALAFERPDFDSAGSYALRSNAIARPREYLSLLFRNCYYLRAIAQAQGDVAAAKQNERTLKSYLNRVDPDLPEVGKFRAELAGGRP